MYKLPLHVILFTLFSVQELPLLANIGIELV